MTLKTPVLVAAIALTAGSVAGGKPSERPSCLQQMSDKQGVLIQSNSRVIVWSNDLPGLIACSRASRRLTDLGTVYPRTLTDVQGRFVLAARHVNDRYEGFIFNARAYDSRTGKVTASAGGYDYPLRAVVTSNGGFAVAARAPGPESPSDPYILVVRPGGAREILDSASGVIPGSLAVAGRRIYWTNAAGVQTADLRASDTAGSD